VLSARQELARTARDDRLEPLALALSPDLAAALGGLESGALHDALRAVETNLYRQLGIALPRPLLSVDDTLAPRGFRLSWRELPEPALQVPESVDVPSRIAADLHQLARSRAADCVDIEEVQRMLTAVERDKPALVRLLVPRTLSLGLLAEVLRGLLRERVSVRWLPEILEAIAPLAERGERSESLIEAARKALAPRIARELSGGAPLPVLRLSALLEETVGDAVRREPAREWLALPPALAEEIARDVASAQRSTEARALLTQAALRRHMRTLLQDSAPDLAVICPEELLPSTELVLKATVGP
jgi:flagellar biosynthesis component FlhA